jgi:SAM-dependent methyltransferase
MFKALRHLVHFLAYSVRAIGPRTLVRTSLRLLADPDARAHDSGFDARYGTDTTAGLTPVEAAIPLARRRGATMYLPTRDADFATLLDALAWPAELRAAATFVDLGSGKGRVVFLAAMQAFREAVGVELSPVLHQVAERNLARIRPALRSPVRLELGDAAEFTVPAGPIVIYLYHPFREAIAAAVVSRIVASLQRDPRPAAILYGHPTLQSCLAPDVFERGGVFTSAAEGARATKQFRIGWSIFTNAAWLAHGDQRVARGEVA